MTYFTITELCKSDTANRLGINNIPTKEHAENLATLINKLLDPLRIKFNRPIYVTSGYRSEKLNKAIPRASLKSQHCMGQAADIVASRKGNIRAENKKLFDLILTSGIDFDQLIYEKGNNEGPDWIHISYKDMLHNRHEILKTSDGVTYSKY